MSVWFPLILDRDKNQVESIQKLRLRWIVLQDVGEGAPVFLRDPEVDREMTPANTQTGIILFSLDPEIV